MPRQSLEDSVSLFPFLDIMACLIGILILLITAVTLAQVSSGLEDTEDEKVAAEAKRRAVEYREARSAQKSEQKEQERLEQLKEQAETAKEQLQSVTQEVQNLESERQDMAVKNEAQRKELEELRTEAAQLQEAMKDAQEMKTLAVEQTKVQKELTDRQQPPPEAEVKIQPSGSGYSLDPTFVECQTSHVVLHEGEQPTRIPLSSLAANAAYAKLLDTVKQQQKGTIVFLVRPDGIRTYNSARNIARGKYVRNGKLAVAGQGKLDLTLFRPGGGSK